MRMLPVTAVRLSALTIMSLDLVLSARADVPPFGCASPDPNSTLASLKQIYGAANIGAETIEVVKGDRTRVTVLYPDDKTRRVLIYWKDQEHQKGILEISIRQDPKADPREWTVGGIKIGTTLAQLEAINGKPFSISGFDWAGGGYTHNWYGGKLGLEFKKCHLTIGFAPDPEAKGPSREHVSGEKEFLSTDLDMNIVRPTVKEILLSYP